MIMILSMHVRQMCETRCKDERINRPVFVNTDEPISLSQ